ncbi:MAG: hypothetical protein DLM62_17110 [Pseudonocardiales bacterium]|nr:MAG: hypothetical protein DLM62_17110 [Pseudonocardiales bacterium]
MASDRRPVAELLVPGLHRLLDDVDQAVIVEDGSGRIQLLNAAARRLFPHLALGDEFERGGEFELVRPGGRRVNGRLRPLVDGWHAWLVNASVSDEQFIHKASRELAAAVAHDATAAALVRLAVPTVGQQAAVLVPAARARMSWWHCAGDGIEPADGVTRAPAVRTAPVLAGALRGDIAATTTVPTSELGELAAVLRPDVADGVPVVAAPLLGSDRTEGLLVVVRPVADTLLTQLAALAGPIIGTSRRWREQTKALALLQAPLLPLPPDALPELPGVQFGVAYRAAGELAVGGDFYFVRPDLDGGAFLGLGDVCGNGAEALAESARVQHSLAALMIVEQDPARLLYLLNRALLAAGRTIFTTMVLGALHRAAAGWRLTFATGGHPAPMVLRGSGHVEDVGVPGTVVGILPEARFGRTSITLAPGDTCLLYSDGVTEANRRTGGDQEQFGPTRLAACLRDCAGMTAQAVATRVERTVKSWLGRDDGDDLALLAIRAVEPVAVKCVGN